MDKSCSINDWKAFSTFNYCTVHRVKFDFKDKCPKSPTTISDGKLEKAKSEVSPRFHKLYKDSHKLSQPVKVPRKYDIGGVWERLHSFGVKFVAVVDWDLVEGRVVRLRNNVMYKVLDFDSAIVKVFRRSVLVTLRRNQDIRHESVREAEKIAQNRVNDVLRLLPKCIVVSDSNIASVHNAFVNHPTARYGVRVDVDGESRLISDNSKGRAEFEAVNTVYAVSDSEKLEVLNRDIITNVWDVPSVTKSKLDTILQVQLDYAENIKKHLAVQDETLNVLRSMDAHFSDSVHEPIVSSDSGRIYRSVSYYRQLRKLKIS